MKWGKCFIDVRFMWARGAVAATTTRSDANMQRLILGFINLSLQTR